MQVGSRVDWGSLSLLGSRGVLTEELAGRWRVVMTSEETYTSTWKFSDCGRYSFDQYWGFEAVSEFDHFFNPAFLCLKNQFVGSRISIMFRRFFFKEVLMTLNPGKYKINISGGYSRVEVLFWNSDSADPGQLRQKRKPKPKPKPKPMVFMCSMCA